MKNCCLNHILGIFIEELAVRILSALCFFKQILDYKVNVTYNSVIKMNFFQRIETYCISIWIFWSKL